MSTEEAKRIYTMAEPWIVLAIGSLITASCTRNFAVLDLLKAPIRASGKIENGIAGIVLPGWFPVDEAFFETPDGSVYTKVRDLPLPRQNKSLQDNTVQALFSTAGANLPPHISSFTLTYFPWFRFLAEPISFDAFAKVAEYVANCFRFLLVREGFSAHVEGVGDERRVVTTAGIRIEFHGMAALRKVHIADDTAESIFDIDARHVTIDRRMFPAAFAAGQEMLKTPDRLSHMAVMESGNRLILEDSGDLVLV